MTLLDFLNRVLGGIRLDSPPPGQTKPATLPLELSNRHLNRPIVFDPAMRQHIAHRAGEPTFATAAEASIWYSIRLTVLNHVLAVVSHSPWRDYLVLRGSGLMVSWFGEQARRPGDLDWVVVPAKWKANSKESKRLIAELLSAIEGTSVGVDIMIPPKSHAIEKIWTYERAPGIRVVIPWSHSSPEYNGTVQLDFVFGEMNGDGGSVDALSQSVVFPQSGCRSPAPNNLLPGSCCGWHRIALRWERTCTTQSCLQNTSGRRLRSSVRPFRLANSEFAGPPLELNRDVVLNWVVEWNEFLKEYPNVAGTAHEWLQRLADALNPLFDDLKANENSHL